MLTLIDLLERLSRLGNALNLESLSGQEGGISTPAGLPRRGPRLAPLFSFLNAFCFNLSEFYSNLAAWISFALPAVGRSVAGFR